MYYTIQNAHAQAQMIAYCSLCYRILHEDIQIYIAIHYVWIPMVTRDAHGLNMWSCPSYIKTDTKIHHHHHIAYTEYEIM